MTTATALSIPGGSVAWCHERLTSLGVDVDRPQLRDAERC
jgi:hypothetical protein